MNKTTLKKTTERELAEAIAACVNDPLEKKDPEGFAKFIDNIEKRLLQLASDSYNEGFQACNNRWRNA